MRGRKRCSRCEIYLFVCRTPKNAARKSVFILIEFSHRTIRTIQQFIFIAQVSPSNDVTIWPRVQRVQSRHRLKCQRREVNSKEHSPRVEPNGDDINCHLRDDRPLLDRLPIAHKSDIKQERGGSELHLVKELYPSTNRPGQR